MMSSVDPNTSGNVKVNFYHLPYLDTHESKTKNTYRDCKVLR